MLKLSTRRPIETGKGTLLAILATLLCASLGGGEAEAFPLTSGASANRVIGQADFNAGFVSFATDPVFGARAASASSLFVPSDVAYDEDRSRLFVADMHNHRIVVYDLAAGIAANPAAVYVLGQPNLTTGGTGAGNLYGNKNTQNAAQGCTTAVNGCGLGRAWAMAFDSGQNRLYVADTDNHRVLVWNFAAGITNGMSASNVLGQPSFSINAKNAPCSGGSTNGTNSCGLSRPSDVLIDPQGFLYVADTGNHRVLVYNTIANVQNGMAAWRVLGQPSLQTSAPHTGCGGVSGVSACSLSEPSSLALDPVSRRLFVAEQKTSRVLVFDVFGVLLNGQAATGVLGQPDFTTKTVNTSCGGGASGPSNTNACGFGFFGVRIDYDTNADRLYVADGSNHRVLVFDTQFVVSGEAAVAVLGQSDFVSGYNPDHAAFGGATSRSRMISPEGVTYDPIGDRLFVADGGNHRVLVFGANIAGTPVEVTGTVTNTDTTDNPDGSTTVDATGILGNHFIVLLPPGSTPLTGAGEIEVDITSAGTDDPRILVNATLPPGGDQDHHHPHGQRLARLHQRPRRRRLRLLVAVRCPRPLQGAQQRDLRKLLGTRRARRQPDKPPRSRGLSSG